MHNTVLYQKHMAYQRCSQSVFFTEALDEFQHVIVRIWKVKRVACDAKAETFTEVVGSVALMVATVYTPCIHTEI